MRALDLRRRQSFTREPAAFEERFFYPDPAITAKLLSEFAGKVAKSIEELNKLPQIAVAEIISISEKIKDLQSELLKKVEIKLFDLIKKSKSKTEIIVTFLALLELIKQNILTVEQEELFADIMIKKSEA